MTEMRIINGVAFYLDGSPTNPVIVLGHALGADYQVWNEVTEALCDDFYIVRWDHPGHGNSSILELSPADNRLDEIDKPLEEKENKSTSLQMEQEVDLLVNGLDQLGIDQFCIGGISFGGMVALAVAQQIPVRVNSLIMLDSGPRLTPSEAWIQKADLVRELGTISLVESTMDRWFTPEFAEGEGKEKVSRTRSSFLACNDEGYAQCCQIISSTDLRSGLNDISMPTLLITGQDDAGMTPEDIARLAENIPGTVALSTANWPEECGILTSNFQPTNKEKSSFGIVVAPARHLSCVEQPGKVVASIRILLRQCT